MTSTSLAAGANGLNFFTTSAGGWFTSINADGFTLNSAAAENNASGVTYHYIVWNEVNGFTDQGTYVGNGADNRNITGVGFEPEYVITFSSNAQEATQHSGAIGAAVDNSMFFAGIAGLTNRVQALQADGFQVGSALDVNENTRNHFYIAWTRIQGPPRMISGSYTGNATDNRAITGLGFRPDFVIVKGATAQTGVFRSSRMAGDASKPATGATALTANLVQTLDADGFTIGTDARVNGSGVVCYWVAFSGGAGEMVVNNYTGNGADNRSITGLGFQPEYVAVMSEAANDAVHRSTGSWLSALGAPGSFREMLGQFSVAGEPLALRLNDDNRTDLFVYNAQTGQWLQAMSLGDGRFVTSTGSWPTGLEVVSGDLDGNGRDDLFAHHANGSWFQAFPDGDGDYRYRYGAGLPAGHAYAADFNADGRADVFVYNASTGQWTMAFSTNDNSPSLTHGTWTAGWQPVVARLNADNAADLVLWHAESGAWVQCFRDPSQFFVYRTGNWTAGGTVQAIDLNGDGRDELLRYDWRTGDWTLATLDSAGVMQQSNGLWEIGWEVTPGDLNGDGRQDVLLYNPDTGEWIRRLNLSTGWVDDVSGLWLRNWTVAGRRR